MAAFAEPASKKLAIIFVEIKTRSYNFSDMVNFPRLDPRDCSDKDAWFGKLLQHVRDKLQDMGAVIRHINVRDDNVRSGEVGIAYTDKAEEESKVWEWRKVQEFFSVHGRATLVTLSVSTSNDGEKDSRCRIESNCNGPMSYGEDEA
jgi:hypothetical protein